MTTAATQTAATMNKKAAELILGLSGEYTLPELRTAFRRALTNSPNDQSVYDAYSCLVEEFGGEDVASHAATGFNPETAAYAAAAVHAAVAEDKNAEYEMPAPVDAPGWYKFGRKVLQHLPYRVMFLLFAIALYCGYAANPVGAMAFVGHVAFGLLATLNLFVPIITNPIRRLAIKLFAFIYKLTEGQDSVNIPNATTKVLPR